MQKTGGRILTIYRSFDVFLRKELPFGGRDDCISSLSSDVLIFLLFFVQMTSFNKRNTFLVAFRV